VWDRVKIACTYNDAGRLQKAALICHHFGLLGGTSSWKTNAPTIQVTLDRSLQVTGWVTQDINPNAGAA
jgi:hypothetical protein